MSESSTTPADISQKRHQFLTHWLEVFSMPEPEPDAGVAMDEPSAADLGIPMPDPYPEALPSAGEIRLMAPEKVPDCPRPLYLAVLGPWMGDGMVLAAPFSLWPVPAVPGELLLSTRPPGLLRTLCLWNARSLPLWTLLETWQAGGLDPAELAEARAVFRSQFLGRELPPALLARTGPEIADPDDPRVAYIEAETALMGPLQNDALWHMRVTEMLRALDDSSPALDDIVPVLNSEDLVLCRRDAEESILTAGSASVLPAAIFLRSAEELISRMITKQHIEVLKARVEELRPLSEGIAKPVGQWRLVAGTQSVLERLRGFLLLDGIEAMAIIGRGIVTGDVATLASGNVDRLTRAAKEKGRQFLVFHC